ncbi:MAG: fibronectin type III domain-containing protein, partial [Patescibacteria group bacterium]
MKFDESKKKTFGKIFIFSVSIFLLSYLHTDAATSIYRSLSPTATSAVATTTASGFTLSISASTATFSGAQPNNVGIGDAIQYDSDNNGSIDAIAFIHSRTSSTVYTVKSASGGTPTATSADDTDWSVFRAYISMSNAETGTENTGINSGVRNFDTWSSGRNLVSSDEQWNIAAYGGSAETTLVTIAGWTTDSTHYLRIFTPVSTAEVGASQRHSGAWDDTKYNFTPAAFTTNTQIISIAADIAYIRLEGLQFKLSTNSTQAATAISFGTNSLSSDVRLSNNIIIAGTLSGSPTNVTALNVSSSATSTLSIFNNLFYDFTVNSVGQIVSSVPGTGFAHTINFYNNTIYNSRIGFTINARTVIKAINNLFSSVTTVASGTFIAGTDYNATNNSSIGYTVTGSGNTHDRVSQTFVFSDESSDNFHLAVSDSAAKARGLSDPGAGLFSDDIDGATRSGSWDIGADENDTVDSDAPVISSIASSTTETTATITWTTNELATSTVKYGLNSSYGTSSTTENTYTSHSITLPGLTASTLYHFQVSSGDSSYNYATSSDYTFTTTAADVSAPVISSIASTTATSTATVTWTTNELSTSTLEYGLTNSYGTASSSVVSVTSHSISVSSLTPDTAYHFRVSSRDSSGNVATSSDYILTTEAIATTTYYVDRGHASSSDSNPGTEALPFLTIQKAVTLVNPGDTVLIKAGTYPNLTSYCAGSSCELVNITRSGTSARPIVIKAYNSDIVTLDGFGFSDADLNSDGEADGPFDPAKREVLFHINADYIHLSNIIITDSQQVGLKIDGSYNVIENVSSNNNWGSGLSLGADNLGAILGNTISHFEAHHNRHSGGIEIHRPAGATGLLRYNIIENSMSYRNGYKADDVKVLPIGGDPAGGGNSDGVVSSKYCVDVALNNAIPGFTNACPNNIFRGNVVWTNADDGVDVNMSDSLVENNITFDNGPEGDQGLKVFNEVNNVIFVGNISYKNDGRGYDLRVPYGGVYINNLGIYNASHGIFNMASTSVAYNNLGAFNVSNDIVIGSGCSSCSHNWAEDGNGGNLSGNPNFVNPTLFQDGNGEIVFSFPENLTIAEKVDWLKSQFRSAFSLLSTSQAIDAGISASWIDPITGATSSRSVTGAAPDIGPFEYSAGSDTTAPTISSIASSTNTTSATITWTTNESATSSVEYGITSSYGSRTISDVYVTSHSTSLSGLTPNTLYHFRVSSSDSSGNIATSSDKTFTTSALADSTPPVITLVSATPSNTTALITWTTDEASDSQVNFSPRADFIASSSLDSNLVTSHSVTLSNLKPCIKYRYRVRSADSSTNFSFSSSTAFFTNGCTGGANVLNETTSNIGFSGGSVSLLSSGSGISLSIPSQYSSQASSSDFQIKKLDKDGFITSAQAPTGKGFVGNHVYNLTSLPTATSSLSSFSKSLNITISYDDSDITGTTESLLKIYRYDDGAWNALENCAVDQSANSITCDTANFSEFVLVADTETESSSSSSSSTSSSSGTSGNGSTGMVSNISTYGLSMKDKWFNISKINDKTLKLNFKYSPDIKTIIISENINFKYTDIIQATNSLAWYKLNT